MSLTESIETILKKEGATLIRELQALLVSTGANASGKTSRSLTNDVTTTDTNVRMELHGGTGWAFVEQGRGKTRKKGNGQLRGIIKQWIADKGIVPDDGMSVDTLSFLITRAIHKRGTLLNFLQERREIYTAVLTEDRLNRIYDMTESKMATSVGKTLIDKLRAI